MVIDTLIDAEGFSRRVTAGTGGSGALWGELRDSGSLEGVEDFIVYIYCVFFHSYLHMICCAHNPSEHWDLTTDKFDSLSRTIFLLCIRK